jgi:2'-5' RNA ligase
MSTIGILLAIPEPYGGELQARRAAYGDPQAAVVPMHVTLLPPTEIDPDVVPEVAAHLTAVGARSKPFRMRLRGTGTFRPVSQVVFVQIAQGLPECVALEARIRSGLLDRELQFPYHPHVTVAHDLGRVELDAAFKDLAEYEAEFDLAGFGLYELGLDGTWRQLSFYPFEAPSDRSADARAAA